MHRRVTFVSDVQIQLCHFNEVDIRGGEVSAFSPEKNSGSEAKDLAQRQTTQETGCLVSRIVKGLE